MDFLCLTPIPPFRIVNKTTDRFGGQIECNIEGLGRTHHGDFLSKISCHDKAIEISKTTTECPPHLRLFQWWISFLSNSPVKLRSGHHTYLLWLFFIYVLVISLKFNTAYFCALLFLRRNLAWDFSKNVFSSNQFNCVLLLQYLYCCNKLETLVLKLT